MEANFCHKFVRLAGKTKVFFVCVCLQVSILSLAIEGSANLTALRSLRTLRALRPLRAISRWQGMKVQKNKPNILSLHLGKLHLKRYICKFSQSLLIESQTVFSHIAEKLASELLSSEYLPTLEMENIHLHNSPICNECQTQ